MAWPGGTYGEVPVILDDVRDPQQGSTPWAHWDQLRRPGTYGTPRRRPDGGIRFSVPLSSATRPDVDLEQGTQPDAKQGLDKMTASESKTEPYSPELLHILSTRREVDEEGRDIASLVSGEHSGGESKNAVTPNHHWM